MADNKTVMKVLPSVFAEATYLLDGKPFRLTDRHYLKPIYDGDIEDGILMCGRQVEKSTTDSTHMSNYTLLIPYFKALYVAPLTEQVRVFSRERLGKLYEYSQNDIVKKNYIDKNCTQAVMQKDFTNGSINYFRHCYDQADNIRSITVNGVWIDEIQDIHVDAIPVIKETQAHALDTGAKQRITWFTGTPKTFSNTIQQYWDRSTQNEWVVRCPHCGEYQILGVKNLTPTAFVCRKCKQPIPKDSIINGFWYELQPGRKLKGYRISQLMVPWITAADIWDKYTSYSPDRFHNEVLGRSYENASKPFNPLTLAQISNNDLAFYPRAEREFANAKIFMGVDWGTGEKSYTVVSIGAFNREGKFQYLYFKRYERGDELDPEYQLKDIINLMNLYKVAFALVDWGFGFVQYKKLQSIFGNRVAACYYSFNQNAERKYDPLKMRWVVNRTKFMQNYITAVQSNKVVWPGRNKAEYPWMFDHHLAEMAEYTKSQNGRSEELMYNHPEGQPDDGLHANIYCYNAALIFNQTGSGSIQFASAYGGII